MGEEERIKIKVNIVGKEYTLQTSQSKEHIMEVVNYVDNKIREQKDKTGTSLDAAVLAALHIADEYIKLLKEHNEILNTLEKYAKLVTEQVEETQGNN
ncbi:MAG: cell division protein ZapA [bacterium]